MQALIDGDIVCYRCAASANDQDVEIALLRVDQMMQDILTETQASSYRVFIGGDSNFRYQYYPEYKATRRTKPRPQWLQACQDYLIKNWNAEITNGYETDDALGMYQTSETIICSIDKDLLQIPGRHYNFVNHEFITVDPFEGLRSFYWQLLKGDRTDDVWGLSGVGSVKAWKYLEGCETEEEMLNVARALYQDDLLLDKYAKCLWLWRFEGDVWDKLSIGNAPYEQELEHQSGSIMQPQEETNQSTEPTTQEKNGSQSLGQSKESIEPTTNKVV
jgi:5'-3' exonuclease